MDRANWASKKKRKCGSQSAFRFSGFPGSLRSCPPRPSFVYLRLLIPLFVFWLTLPLHHHLTRRGWHVPPFAQFLLTKAPRRLAAHSSPKCPSISRWASVSSNNRVQSRRIAFFVTHFDSSTFSDSWTRRWVWNSFSFFIAIHPLNDAFPFPHFQQPYNFITIRYFLARESCCLNKPIHSSFCWPVITWWAIIALF